jgi:4-hydroxy-tetrahydrodipicolinate synthase
VFSPCKLMTAMVTPFDAHQRVDFAKMAELTEHLLAEGTDGLLVCGTTGESPTLTHDEKLELFRTVKAAARGRAPVIAGVGSNATAATIELAKEAADLGVDALLVVNPYYNKPPQEGLYRHFKAVAEATDLPNILYNIQGRTAVNLEVSTLARLAALPNIVGVKEASGNLDQVSETVLRVGAGHGVLAAPGESFQVYSGDDSLTLPMLAVGACGVVSVASHVVGKPMREMIEALGAGDVGRAAALHRRLLPLFKGLFATTNPILVKAALRLRGLDVGGLRLPLVEATPEQVQRLEAIMGEVGALA